MFKYDVLPLRDGYSVWIELRTLHEVSLEDGRKTKPAFSQLMAKSHMLEIESRYGVTTNTVPFADILKAFPDIDPENTYITLRFQLGSVYKWSPLNG